MDIEIKTWLYDILNAITEIAPFFEDQPSALVRILTKYCLEEYRGKLNR